MTKYLPFELNRLKIENKELLDLILSQISKILHVLERDY